MRDVEVEWRLFSLQLIHAGKEDPLADLHVKGTPALRTLALVRRTAGNEGVDAVYAAIGARVHDGGEELDYATVERALEDAGFDGELVARALDDDSTMDDVRRDHEAAVEETGAFGVPTLVLSSGRAMFGPVIARAPHGEAAGELWDQVSALIEVDGFFELKRERDWGPG